VLGRSDVIALAAAAADAMAAGTEAPPLLDEADGRRFTIRLPFGCNGPAASSSTDRMRWRYDAATKALRLHAAATVWTLADWSLESPPAQEGIADADSEADRIKGFWIERPWTSSESCPPAAAEPVGEPGGASDSAAAALPEHSLALGQVTSAKGRRSGRVYDAVIKMAEDDLDTSKGFSLKVSGRITRLPGAGTVRCRRQGGPEQRPACLVGAVIDEVAIENPASGKTLATWNPAPRDAPER
jgi:hypothetical protein